MIDFISAHLAATYFVAAFAFAIAELRMEGRVGGPGEAFWMVVLIAGLFPVALIRRTYIITSQVALWMITPSNRKQRKAAADEAMSIIDRVKKTTSKST